MHSRLTLNQVSLAENATAVPGADAMLRDIELCQAAGIERIGIRAAMLEANGWGPGIEQLRNSALQVTHLVHRAMFELDNPASWPAAQERGRDVAAAAAALDAPLVYLTSGPAGSLLFEQAAEAFVAAVAPVVGFCAERGVELAVETANPQYHDIHMLHTLRDTIDVANRAGMKVCVDLHACWTEPNLRTLLRDASGSIALVQLGDYSLGQHSLTRAIPGEGMIPLERIVGWLVDDGYQGLFDLEFPGDHCVPRASAVQRAVQNMDAMMVRLGL